MTPQHQPQATPHFREPYYQDSAANSLSADTFVRMEEGRTNTINSVQDCWMQILRLREDLNTECRCGASAKKQLAITEAGITTPLDTVYPAPMPLTTTPIMNFHHITSRLLNSLSQKSLMVPKESKMRSWPHYWVFTWLPKRICSSTNIASSYLHSCTWPVQQAAEQAPALETVARYLNQVC